MTKQELDAKIDAITREAEEKKRLAYKQYVAENAKYKVGDVVRDATDAIRVERVRFTVVYRDISIFYWGVLLTKKGVPRKDGERRAIYEERIIND